MLLAKSTTNKMKFINIFIRISIFYTTITFGQKIIYTKKYSSGNPKIISYHLTEGIDEVVEHQYFGSGSIKKEGIYQFGKSKEIGKYTILMVT